MKKRSRATEPAVPVEETVEPAAPPIAETPPSSPEASTFASLGLPATLLQAVDGLGYEAPSSIQAAAIPALLAGRDLLGQAQTGTGKTAAFALPLLARLVPGAGLQVLVLTPTRELAIQVAEAMQTYARHLPDFQVLPVYGGQDIESQMRHLRRSVQVVVGTPGRIQDHLRRGTLKLDKIRAVVLDEADEMLRMGFLEAVEAILDHTPAEKQVALFSATLPGPIKTVARRYLREPVEVQIVTKTATVATVTQRYWPVQGVHKLDALTRILEVEDFEAMLIFVRTKVATVELAERLEARGFACAALNGDLSQALRERTIERLRGGQLDIVVATDVAARGLDVERISHVVNFDIPYDVESYVHRIGRTGRAGREGVAILFVSHREQHTLRAIERATRQPIERMTLPTHEDVSDRRVAQFKETVSEALAEADLDFFVELVEAIEREQETSSSRVSAALAFLLQKARPLQPERTATGRDAERPVREARGPMERPARSERVADRAPRASFDRERPAPFERSAASERPPRVSFERETERPERGERPEREPVDPAMFETFRLAVGATHGVLPKNIVGAIANEAGLEGRFILNIDIQENETYVDLPRDMPPEIFHHLRKVRIRGQNLEIQPVDGPGPEYRPPTRPAPRETRDSGGRPGFKPGGPRPGGPAGPRTGRPTGPPYGPKREGGFGGDRRSGPPPGTRTGPRPGPRFEDRLFDDDPPRPAGPPRRPGGFGKPAGGGFSKPGGFGKNGGKPSGGFGKPAGGGFSKPGGFGKKPGGGFGKGKPGGKPGGGKFGR
ncbi:MAG: DEAD/DEAH box helicase [Thermoanaerobaculia bacterium]|nr:DEAD/DEAH box helicase [Thermoanaerobaculia bacterium]